MSAGVTDYTALVTSEHSGKPNFVATVAASVQPLVDSINALQSLPPAFDLDDAEGDQLDILGQWIGASRDLAVPLTGVYFGFDQAGVGFEQGTWFGPFDPTTGLVSLPDDTYRILLRAVIAANKWDGTIPGAYAAYNDLFSPLGGQILIFDHGDMSITLGYLGPTPTAVVAALLKDGLLSLKPATVGISGYIAPSVSGAPFFGFDIESSVISGFDTGAWGVSL